MMTQVTAGEPPGPPTAYLGDKALDRLLARAGKSAGLHMRSAREVRALLRGVLAAPDAGDAWIRLVAERPTKALAAQLQALRATMAAAPGAAPLAMEERLAALRARLRKDGVEGFIVPRTDAHQGEYVPPSEARLAWLTGFTGSAGTAVVLADKAALFVDGRYTLQAAKEVDRKRFAIHHVTRRPPSQWVRENLPKGARLGFDPWLLTPGDVARFETACGNAGGRLVALSRNPVDAVWRDRPAPPISPVRALALKHAGRSSAEKRRAIAAGLAARGADAAFLAAPESIAWLLNIRGRDLEYSPLALAFAVIAKDRKVTLAIDPRKLTAAARRHLGPEVTVVAPNRLGAALDVLGRRKRTVELDPARSPYWAKRRLARAGAVVREAPDPCLAPKAAKNRVELGGIREAHVRDGAALTRFLAWLDAKAPNGKLTEVSAAQRLDALRAENDRFQGLSFPTISGSGPNGAIVHYHASEQSNRRIRPGDVYLVDSGGQYLDGTTDVTRTVHIAGKGRPGATIRDAFTRVLKGHIALAWARFPAGTSGAQLDVLARAALWEAGLEYDHGTGHGVGHFLNVHEGPQRISQVPNSVALEPGMVLSDEPGFYKPGAFGIRIENLVAVKADGKGAGGREMRAFEVLTLAPIDQRLIEPKLLDETEKAWLNAYHAHVVKTLGPRLGATTRAWLEKATAPIR